MSMQSWSNIPSSSFLKDDPFFDPNSNSDTGFKAIPLPDDNIGFDPPMEPNELDQLYTTLDLQDLGISTGYEQQQEFQQQQQQQQPQQQQPQPHHKQHGRKISGSGIFGYIGKGADTQLSIPGMSTPTNVNVVEFYKKKPVYQEITKFDNIDYSKAHNPVYPNDLYDDQNSQSFYQSQLHQQQQMQQQFQLQQQQIQHQLQHLHHSQLTPNLEQQQYLHHHQQHYPQQHQSHIHDNNQNIYKNQPQIPQKSTQSLPMSAIQQQQQQQQLQPHQIPNQYQTMKSNSKKEAPDYIFNADFDGKFRFPRPKTPPLPVINNYNADYLRFINKKPDGNGQDNNNNNNNNNNSNTNNKGINNTADLDDDDDDDAFNFFMDEPITEPITENVNTTTNNNDKSNDVKEFITPINKKIRDISGVMAITPLRISKPIVGLETPPSLKVPNHLSWTPTIVSKKTPRADKFLREELSQPKSPIRKHSTITTLLPRGQLDSYFEGPDEKHMFTCVYNNCGRTFTRISNIRAHIQTHLCDRPFICEVCRMTFVRNHDLKRHEKGHQEFQFQCPCGKKFSRKDAMKRHQIRMICEGGIPDEQGILKRNNNSNSLSHTGSGAAGSSGDGDGKIRKRGRPRKATKQTEKNLIEALNDMSNKSTPTTVIKNNSTEMITTPIEEDNSNNKNSNTNSNTNSSNTSSNEFDEEGITDLEIRMNRDYELFNSKQQNETNINVNGNNNDNGLSDVISSSSSSSSSSSKGLLNNDGNLGVGVGVGVRPDESNGLDSYLALSYFDEFPRNDDFTYE